MISIKLLNNLKNIGTRLALINADKKVSEAFQRALNDMGKHLVVDGDIGPITIKAIKEVSNKELRIRVWDILYPKEKNKSELQYIQYAINELGVHEIPGKGSNRRVEQYHSAVGYPNWSDDVPWCASFVGFIMLKAGYSLPELPARALSWKNFGKKVSKPIYGAIAVKKRKGGGHVTFVVGTLKNSNYLVCLGGNQGDKVGLSIYHKSKFKYFRVPNDYPSKEIEMPIYTNLVAAKIQVKES